MCIKDLKFSLWADFIERDFLDNEFKTLIKSKTINGATSNPAIFKNAILNSPAYIDQIKTLGELSPKQKYEAVAIFDIKKAADILRPLYDDKNDGYVSIEVDPFLCDDAEGTISEGKRLFAEIARPNVMIKIPATKAGYIAMEELVASKIPVNATLIFTKEQAVSCAKAFEKGIKKAKSAVDTVISVFVSRVDRAIDAILLENGVEVALSGIYNSADIYNEVQSLGVEKCRTLFASTGVKDDSLEAHYYIQNLLAYNSVNTAPIDTIKAYVENANTEKALPISANMIKAHFEKVAATGIVMDDIYEKQIREGLQAFKDAFKDILENL